MPRGLAAIKAAITRSRLSAEIIVVANRCTDRTEALAEDAGAIVVRNGSRNLAAIRNAGVAASTGQVVVTIDADTVMHPRALIEANRLLRTGNYVGGGCGFVPERTSLGISFTVAVTKLAVGIARVGGVMYWCARTDFDAVGGFDESWPLAEDVEFARRLRRLARHTGRRFVNLRGVPATVSCRKFDSFGDWHMFTAAAQASSIRASMNGSDMQFADKYYYDYNT